MSWFTSTVKGLDKKTCIYVFCALLPFILSPLAASSSKESKCAYVMILVASFWLLEPVPIAATSLLPVVLFPLLGVVSSDDICSNYMKESYMMFIGGLIMAIALEECRLHERIALKILLLIGTEIKWLMLGFMLTTMFLSMWVSNTATTTMMVPIVDAVYKKITTPTNAVIPLENCASNNSLTETKQTNHIDEEKASYVEETENKNSSVKTCLLLSVCYSANIGGTGTLTGTGPNLVFKGLMRDLHPESNEITFASWMIYNVPGMLLCIFIAWLYLWMVYIKFSKMDLNISSKQDARSIISKRYSELGPITYYEAEVLILFFILVFLWLLRDPKFMTGWADAIGSAKVVEDSVPAIAVGFLLLFLPSDIRNLRSPPILHWKTVQAKMPWGIIILFGGGFALADGAQKSGLSKMVGEHLSSLQVLPPSAIVAVVCFMTAMFTEIVSNTTTATILLPVFSQMAVSINVNPLFIMLPVTVVCSYAFMLPVATPPNAIAFESGRMRTIEMAKPGFVMNVVCCGIQILMLNTLGVAFFKLDEFPSWANNSKAINLTAAILQNETSIFNK